MILDIDIDPKTNRPTVEGNPNHKLGTYGGGMIRWRCEPGQGHKGWEVKFEGPSPFEDGRTEFGSSHGTDGARLAEQTSERGFKYSVSCIDSDNEKHEADPEIVVWPNVR